MSAASKAHTPTPEQLAGVIRGLDNACAYCDSTSAFDSARNIREAAAAIGLLVNAHSQLVDALKDLIRAYVNNLENARDRIVFLGGDCDPVDVMERGDPYLAKARLALSHLTTRSNT